MSFASTKARPLRTWAKRAGFSSRSLDSASASSVKYDACAILSRRAVRLLKTWTSEKGSSELAKRLRERLAPLAIPVSLPCDSVRKETILSDSPNDQERRTIAGVVRGAGIDTGKFLTLFTKPGNSF